MEDGSSVRTKVAQYFVNKKLQELKSNHAALDASDLTLLQDLPELLHKIDKLTDVSNEPPQLPPLIPWSGSDLVSWDSVLKGSRARQSTIIGRGDQFKIPSWFRVAIIGAGVAGLRTAMLLEKIGIPYKIFEASDRAGGRIFTYEFPSKSTGNPQGKHDYHDVGAMRFPDNDANKATFELFKELGLSSKQIKFIFSIPENVRRYNNIQTTAATASTKGDHFKEGIQRGGMVPQEYLDKKHTDLSGKEVFGINACTAAAFDPFRKALIEDFDKGWEELMKYDWASTRSYLTREKPEYPLSVVHWMESRNSGTGGFDRAFSEAILDSLEFNDPRKGIDWHCLEGGSKVFIDSMLSKLGTKPSYNQRVTSVQLVNMHLPDSLPVFPDLPPPTFPDPFPIPDSSPIPKPVPPFPDPRRLPGHPDLTFPLMKVSVSGQPDECFFHVVSTSSFAALRTIDTERVPMTYKQRQAIRTLNYGPAVKVAIKFKTRWWEQDGQKQRGGSRVHQDAARFGALIRDSDWSKQLDPDRNPPASEKFLLDQIYGDLAVLHGVTKDYLRNEALDYHAFDWYHNPYTMGAFAHFAPGQFSTFFADIVHPAGYGRFHFAGEVASHHHAWVSGALDSAKRAVDEILSSDLVFKIPEFRKQYGKSAVFSDEKSAEAHFIKGLYSLELEKAGFD